ncbi:hypothetical protein Scani_64640 [Streptomyces caniferus]|uniref:Uncharacterized protein n=1 Tax=Streptomyces caniferus TaxID=285557 RepID=A0A640SJ67_9ACTN|nr:hypothetical protein Scani_64640 [Streptomyces caniferus]
MRIDVRDVCALHVGRVEDQFARLVTGAHRDAVQLQQPAHHTYVTDIGHVAQSAGTAAEEGGDHGLRHKVLRAANPDLALERGAAVDKQYVVSRDGHGSRVPGDGQGPS